MTISPTTVTEAVALLTAEGYVADLESRHDDAREADHSHEPTDLVIERVYRFEGDSDPGDEAIVIGVFCSDCERRGVVVSAFGPDADPILMDRLHKLG